MTKKSQPNSFSYWCTWKTQVWTAKNKIKDSGAEIESLFLGDQGARNARSEMNEKNLFGDEGWTSYFSEIRNDLILVLDDGWDVPYGVHPDKHRDLFGSLIVNEERFPFLHGSEKERLKQLSDRIKACGWKGMGIWIAAQIPGEQYGKPFDRKVQEKYWIERLLWSKYADIMYWKVDWGWCDNIPEFRAMLTELARKIYPELIVEHAVVQQPLNGFYKGILTNDGRFIDNKDVVSLTDKMLQVSPVFRSYDVTDSLSVATTLDRVFYLLKNAIGLINVEDEPYIGASLGCLNGIMRSAVGRNYTPAASRLKETVAAIKWQRIAPAFSGGTTLCSEELLTDYHDFKSGETWFAPAIGKMIKQSAPAVIARNTALPIVKGKSGSYITCCSFSSGAYAIAAHECNDKEIKQYLPEVLCENIGSPETVGVFGRFGRLELNTSRKIKKITAKGLASSIIAEANIFNNGRIVIDGAFIEKFKSDDDSAPTFTLSITYQ